MLKNPLQKIFYPLVILSTFLCVPYILAEEVDPVPNPHPVHELCNVWTLAEWEDLPYGELEKKLLASDHSPLSKREATAVSLECWLFAVREKLRKANLAMDKVHQEILDNFKSQ